MASRNDEDQRIALTIGREIKRLVGDDERVEPVIGAIRSTSWQLFSPAYIEGGPNLVLFADVIVKDGLVYAKLSNGQGSIKSATVVGQVREGPELLAFAVIRYGLNELRGYSQEVLGAPEFAALRFASSARIQTLEMVVESAAASQSVSVRQPSLASVGSASTSAVPTSNGTAPTYVLITQHPRERSVRPFITGGILGAALLFIAAAPLDYGYYIFLRLAITGTSIWLAIAAARASQRAWVVVGVVLAVLFNPFVPVWLSKGVWIPLDVAGGIVMVIAAFLVRPKISSPSP